MAESQYWCWTLFSTNGTHENRVYEREYPDELKAYATQRGNVTVTYTRAQEECCSSSGRFHLQGYVEFKERVKFSTLKNTFSKRIRWGKRRGNAQQADDYCNKEETQVPGGLMWCKGNISKIKGPGERTDLTEIYSELKSGKKRKHLAENHFGTYVKYHRGIEAAAAALDIDLDENCSRFIDRECYIIYGTPGSGKSLMANLLIQNESFYIPEQNAQGRLSFESYKNEKWILLDDFDPKSIDMAVLKRMMDKGKVRLPGRNTSRIGHHIGVVITTNHDPETWTEGPMQDTEWKAISRRCRVVWHSGIPTWTVLAGTSQEYKVGQKLTVDLQEWIDKVNALDSQALQSTEPQAPVEPQGSQEDPICL